MDDSEPIDVPPGRHRPQHRALAPRRAHKQNKTGNTGRHRHKAAKPPPGTHVEAAPADFAAGGTGSPRSDSSARPDCADRIRYLAGQHGEGCPGRRRQCSNDDGSTWPDAGYLGETRRLQTSTDAVANYCPTDILGDDEPESRRSVDHVRADVGHGVLTDDPLTPANGRFVVATARQAIGFGKHRGA